jgi:hypothetical protein
MPVAVPGRDPGTRSFEEECFVGGVETTGTVSLEAFLEATPNGGGGGGLLSMIAPKVVFSESMVDAVNEIDVE